MSLQLDLKHRTLKHWTLKHWNIERMLLQIWCWFIGLFSPLPAQSLCCPQSQLPRASSDLEDWTRLKVVVNCSPHLQEESSHQFERRHLGVHWQNTPWLNHFHPEHLEDDWHACSLGRLSYVHRLCPPTVLWCDLYVLFATGTDTDQQPVRNQREDDSTNCSTGKALGGYFPAAISNVQYDDICIWHQI